LQFLQEGANQGRYRFLENLAETYRHRGGAFRRLPASDLTQKLGSLNYRRIETLIRNSPDYEAYKFAILGALYDCEDYQAFFPQAVLAAMKRDLDFYLEDTKRVQEKSQLWRFLEVYHETVGKLRFVFEGREISIRSWSMAMRDVAYSFVTPSDSLESFVSSYLIDRDASLEDYRLYQVAASGRKNLSSLTKEWKGSLRDYRAHTCKDLQRLSFSALDQEAGR